MFELVILGVSVGIGTRGEVLTWTEASGSSYRDRKFYKFTSDMTQKVEVSYQQLQS